MKQFIIFLLLTFFISVSAIAKVVKYDLTATQQKVNLSGKKTVDFAISLNGQIPSPTLIFTEGDEAEITVTNKLKHDELSIHWHGLLLPPEMDGVPYVNTPPIKVGQSYTFKFKIRQNGTYWYHSHTDVQEQKGVYGAIIINPIVNKINVDKDIAIVLSDWSDENADQILRNLRKDGDYYLYKKRTMRSWLGAIQQGEGAFGRYLYNQWTRMGGMDLSDVGYDAFLMNGKQDSQLLVAHPGERIRLRVINAAASSYFNVSLGSLPISIISSDGLNIEPADTNNLLIGMAETYDILFTVPERKNYELRATAQDGTGMSSGWIGMGEKIYASKRPLPDPYATMNHGTHANDTGAIDHSMHEMQIGDSHHATHNSKPNKPIAKILESLTVDDVSAISSTEFNKENHRHDVKLVLNGDMSRYVWHINGKTIHQERTLEIKDDDVVRFSFINKTMMHHPMHLHGHFFRVLNKNGSKSPLKHTVDVPPHETRTIEFLANEPGEWMLHCHNLYHLKTGMARVIKYSSYSPKSEIKKWQKLDPHLHDHIYSYGMIETSSNHAQAFLSLSQTWNQLETRIESANIKNKQFSFDDNWDYEIDIFYRRWVNKFFNIIAGGTSYGEEEKAVLGFGYTLPFIIRTNVLLNSSGEFRLDLEKRFQWTKSVFSDVDFSYRPDQNGAHEYETELSFMYSTNWSWAAGLMLTNDSFGGGIELQF